MADLGNPLKAVDLLQDLDPKQLAHLLDVSQRRELKRRQALYFPGDPADALFAVRYGKIKISRLSEDGKEVGLWIVGPGNILGELALVQPGPRDTFAETLEDTAVLSLPIAEIAALMVSDPGFTFRVARLIGQRLREVEERVEDLAHRGVPSRLARVLLRLAQRYGRSEGNGILVSLSLGHQDLANQIGSTRETTTLALNAFKRRGWIEIAPRRLVIKDIARLQALA